MSEDFNRLRDLLDQAVAGDEAAMNDLFQLHRDRLKKMIRM